MLLCYFSGFFENSTKIYDVRLRLQHRCPLPSDIARHHDKRSGKRHISSSSLSSFAVSAFKIIPSNIFAFNISYPMTISSHPFLASLFLHLLLLYLLILVSVFPMVFSFVVCSLVSFSTMDHLSATYECPLVTFFGEFLILI